MDPERWQRAEKIFFAAVALDERDRASFLDQACGADSALLEEVVSLLRSNEKTGGFLEAPALRIDSDSFEGAQEESWDGKRLGAWELGETIGRGGMGVVVRARRADGQFEKSAAVKIVKKGMDTEEILHRFRNERQVLAQLHHPYIARLLDSGSTEDGRPYLVMEYHEGQPIHRYCDEKRLSILQRIRLFREVCKAVQYAHQNLVIHRDLKPENILVSRDGQPILLDFGIAKLLHGEKPGATIAMTRANEQFLTLEYASPEQVAGAPVTTVSDVYSLGTLLYELLTGCRPFSIEGKSPTEAAHIITREEPPKPSTAAFHTDTERAWKRQLVPRTIKKLLAEELDDILLMALRKEPERRYASARELSDDLARYMAGQPVHARPDTFSYRTRKFVQRNRVGVSIAGLLFVSLLAGSAGIAWQAHLKSRALSGKSQALAQAEKRARDLQSFASKLIGETLEKIRAIAGTTAAQAALVRNSLEALDSLFREGDRDPVLQRELAYAYLQVGSMQWSPLHSNLGDMSGARESYERALSLLVELQAAKAWTPESAHHYLVAHFLLGELLLAQGQLQPAIVHLESCLHEAAQDRAPPLAKTDVKTDLEIDTAWIHFRLGNAWHRLGEKERALEFDLRAAELYAIQTNENPRSVFLASRLSLALATAADVATELGRDSQAKDLLRKALSELPDENEKNSPSGPEGKKDEWIAVLSSRARILAKIDDREGAEREFQQAANRMEMLAYQDSSNIVTRKAVASLREEFASFYRGIGKSAEALDQFHRAKIIRQKISILDPADLGSLREAAALDLRLGLIYAERNEPKQAITHFDDYLKGMETLLRADPKNETLRKTLAAQCVAYAELLRRWASDPATPAPEQRKLLELAQAVEAKR